MDSEYVLDMEDGDRYKITTQKVDIVGCCKCCKGAIEN